MPEEYDDFREFESALLRAKVNGLPVEFFTEFLRNIKNGDSVTAACYHAIYEWDL